MLSSNVKTPRDCINLCLKKNPDCKAAEWWASGERDCFECFDPTKREEYTHADDVGYPPHLLVRPTKTFRKSTFSFFWIEDL